MRSAALADGFNEVFDQLLASRQTWDKEPEASLGRRFMARLMRILPIQSQL